MRTAQPIYQQCPDDWPQPRHASHGLATPFPRNPEEWVKSSGDNSSQLLTSPFPVGAQPWHGCAVSLHGRGAEKGPKETGKVLATPNYLTHPIARLLVRGSSWFNSSCMSSSGQVPLAPEAPSPGTHGLSGMCRACSAPPGPRRGCTRLEALHGTALPATMISHVA